MDETGGGGGAAGIAIGTSGDCAISSSVGCVGLGGGSRFWIFHHDTQRGGWPAPPRVHFE